MLLKLIFLCLTFTSFLSARCWIQGTNWNHEGRGEGQVPYLDRHAVRCNSNGILKEAQLKRNHPRSLVRYEYTCCDNNYNNNVQEKTTNWKSLVSYKDTQYSIFELTHHTLDMDCSYGTGINGFRLETKWAQYAASGRYIYQCVDAKVKHYTDKGQGWQDSQRYDSVGFGMKRYLAYLDRVKMSCSDDYPIMGNIAGWGGSSFRYIVHCYPKYEYKG